MWRSWWLEIDTTKTEVITCCVQASFSEINLAAYSQSGTVIDMQVLRNGTKVVR